MNRPSKDLRDLAGLYALDALGPEETAEFEAFLDTSPETQREVEEFRETAASLAAAEASTPPDALRDAVMAEVDVTRQDRPTVVAISRRRISVMSMAVAAALVLIAGIAVVLADRLGEANDVITVLEAPDAVTVTLDSDGTPNLRVVWSASLDQVAVVPGATPTLDDEVYVLWNLPDTGAPQPLAAFDGSDTVLVDATLLADTSMLAITVEVDENVQVPTEPIIAGPEAMDA
jgi:anti-sigma-K factor RskA